MDSVSRAGRWRGPRSGFPGWFGATLEVGEAGYLLDRGVGD
jgi:hypothetical protein